MQGALFKHFLNTDRLGAIITSLGSLFQHLIIPSVKNFFFNTHYELPQCSFKPFLHVLTPDTREKRSSPPSVLRTMRKLQTGMRSRLSLLQAEQTQYCHSLLISHALYFFHCLCCPPLNTFYLYTLLVLWSPKTAQSAPVDTAPMLRNSGTITTFDLLSILCLMHPRRWLALLALRACCWLVLSLTTTKTPGSLSVGLHTSLLSPSL